MARLEHILSVDELLDELEPGLDELESSLLQLVAVTRRHRARLRVATRFRKRAAAAAAAQQRDGPPEGVEERAQAAGLVEALQHEVVGSLLLVEEDRGGEAERADVKSEPELGVQRLNVALGILRDCG